MSNTKRVQVYRVADDEPVMQFDSVKECAKYFGLDSSYISYNIHGKIKTIKNRQYYCRVIDTPYHTTNTATLGNKRAYPIDTYKDGEFIDTFDNVKLAANATGVAPHNIYRHCRGEAIKPTKGYTFKYNKSEYSSRKKIPVDLYDTDTDELYKSFDDINECADFLGLSIQTIRGNLRGEQKTVKVGSFYCKSDKYNE